MNSITYAKRYGNEDGLILREVDEVTRLLRVVKHGDDACDVFGHLFKTPSLQVRMAVERGERIPKTCTRCGKHDDSKTASQYWDKTDWSIGY